MAIQLRPILPMREHKAATVIGQMDTLISQRVAVVVSPGECRRSGDFWWPVNAWSKCRHQSPRTQRRHAGGVRYHKSSIFVDARPYFQARGFLSVSRHHAIERAAN